MNRSALAVLVAALALAPVLGTACKTSQSVGAQVDDTGIKAKVKAKLAKDVRLSTLTNIEVNSTNGVVTLAGQVPNHLDKMKAEEVARKALCFGDAIRRAEAQDRERVTLRTKSRMREPRAVFGDQGERRRRVAGAPLRLRL